MLLLTYSNIEESTKIISNFVVESYQTDIFHRLEIKIFIEFLLKNLMYYMGIMNTPNYSSGYS